MKKSDTENKLTNKATNKVSTIITAAGTGSRFGSERPKQFMLINDKPMIIQSIIPFLSNSVSSIQKIEINEIIITIQDEFRSELESLISDYISKNETNNVPIHLVSGGPTRQESVYNGIQKVSSNSDGVLIHDGARPHLSTELINRILVEVQNNNAVIPVIPVTDTIKQVNQNTVQAHLDRSQLVAVQTPQYFDLDMIRKAYQQMDITDPTLAITDESMLMELINVSVKTVEGDLENTKVTYRSDLAK